MDQESLSRLQDQLFVEQVILDVILDDKFYKRLRSCVVRQVRGFMEAIEDQQYSDVDPVYFEDFRELFRYYFYNMSRGGTAVSLFERRLNDKNRPMALLTHAVKQIQITKKVDILEQMMLSSAIQKALDHQINKAMAEVERDHPEYAEIFRNQFLIYDL